MSSLSKIFTMDKTFITYLLKPWNVKPLTFANLFNSNKTKQLMYEELIDNIIANPDPVAANGCFIRSLSYANVTTCKEIGMSTFRQGQSLGVYLHTEVFDKIKNYFDEAAWFLTYEVLYSKDNRYILRFQIKNDPRLDVLYDFACFIIKYVFGQFSFFYSCSPRSLPLDYFYTFTKDYKAIFYYKWLIGNCNQNLADNKWAYENGIDLKRISLATGLFSYLQNYGQEGMIKEGFDKTFARPVVAYVDKSCKDRPIISIQLSIMGTMSKYTNHNSYFIGWFHHNCLVAFVDWTSYSNHTNDYVRFSLQHSG